jgi:hypothetical protein
MEKKHIEFRELRADEIECRPSICNEYGVGLLLYKDARCDQNILDETVGCMNWQRHHLRDNANCIVSIYDREKERWIEKEDVGKESNTEAEKGLASDSFKRACFNWGIGRELYTAPDMFVFKKDLKTHKETGEFKGKKTYGCKDTFTVTEIQYSEDRKIVYVKVLNNKNGVVIEFGTPAVELSEQEKIAKQKIDGVKVQALLKRCESENVDVNKILNLYKVESIPDLTERQYANINQFWDKLKEQ